MRLEDLAIEFSQQDRPAGIILDDQQVIRQAIVATRYYAGFTSLTCSEGETTSFSEINESTELTPSEWAWIRPLFLLYCERETALNLEASRGFGVEVYGRSVSEINNDISQAEMEMPHRAFCQPVITV